MRNLKEKEKKCSQKRRKEKGGKEGREGKGEGKGGEGMGKEGMGFGIWKDPEGKIRKKEIKSKTRHGPESNLPLFPNWCWGPEAVCGHQSKPHAAAMVSGICTRETMAECSLRNEKAPIWSEAAFSLLSLHKAAIDIRLAPYDLCCSLPKLRDAHCYLRPFLPLSEPVTFKGAGSNYIHNVHVFCGADHRSA